MPRGVLLEYAFARCARFGDEYRALDRSNGFLLSGDWLTVHSENKPDFKKPPLQYWIVAIGLKNFSDINFSTRLPSFFFGIGLLLATGALAYLINPGNAYAAPVSLIVLSSSTFYWQMAVSAFLDSGCRAEQFEELRGWLVDYEIVELSQGYVHWTSKGGARLPETLH